MSKYTAALLLFASSAHGVQILGSLRGEDYTSYRPDGLQVECVGQLVLDDKWLGSAVLVKPNKVLTTLHGGVHDKMVYLADKNTHVNVSSWIDCNVSGSDITILTLERPIYHIEPAVINMSSFERGDLIHIVNRRQVIECGVSSREWTNDDLLPIVSTNTIKHTYRHNAMYKFNWCDEHTTKYESMTTAGDSGSGVFIQHDDMFYLTGLIRGGHKLNAYVQPLSDVRDWLEKHVYQPQTITRHWVDNWFGCMLRFSNGWCYHLDLGWVYVPHQHDDQLWFWMDGWYWTCSEWPQYMYCNSTSEWMLK